MLILNQYAKTNNNNKAHLFRYMKQIHFQETNQLLLMGTYVVRTIFDMFRKNLIYYVF